MAVPDGSQPGSGAAVPDMKQSSPPDMNQMSYAEQYDYLVSQPKGSVNFKKPCKKPSLDAQVQGHSRRDAFCLYEQSSELDKGKRRRSSKLSLRSC